MNAQDKTFRNQIFVALAIVLFTVILSGIGVLMKTSYQSEELKEQVISIQKDKVSTDLFLVYINNIADLTKALQVKDKDNEADIKAINQRLDELAKQIYSTRGKGLTTQGTVYYDK